MIKRPRDTNQLAKLMIDIATGQVKDEPPELVAQAIGGHARAESLTAERRSEIAAKASAARWGRGDEAEGEQADLPFARKGTAGAALGTIMREARNVSERGRWFEDVTLSLLTVEPDLDIKAAWLWAAWPHKPAGRNAQDLGVDIVAEANDGRLIAVQCKCQNDGTTLAKRSIDSFMAEAGTRSIYDELWIVSNVALSRNAVAALNSMDTPCKHILFQAYSNTPLDAGQSPDRREPSVPQRQAIASVLDGFAEHDRGKLIMACGSGKTFTALRIAETLLAETDQPLMLFAAPRHSTS